jgi:hypothetical protein
VDRHPWKVISKALRAAFAAVGPAFLSLAGGVQAHDREVDARECGGLGGDVPAGVDRAPDPGVDALDRVGGTNNRADLLIKSEERYEFGPRSGPEPDNRGILALPFLAELGEGVQRGTDNAVPTVTVGEGSERRAVPSGSDTPLHSCRGYSGT